MVALLPPQTLAFSRMPHAVRVNSLTHLDMTSFFQESDIVEAVDALPPVRIMDLVEMVVLLLEQHQLLLYAYHFHPTHM